MDVQRFFNQDLPAAIRRNPNGAAQIGGTYQFRIDGPGGGQWWVEVTGSKMGVWPGYWPGAQCELALHGEDLARLVEGGPAAADDLSSSGRLVIMGSSTLAARIGLLGQL